MAAMNPVITQSLNEAQNKAVTAAPSNLLVLAGAGSGKTRVLVHRIAWLIEHDQINPESILAVTFTNKAAYEMKARIETLLNYPTHALWIGTFHGLAHRLLRRHHQEAGLSEGFQIIDADDQQRLIKRLLKQLQIDESKWPPKQVCWFINKEKEAGRRPHHSAEQKKSYFNSVMIQIYQAYDTLCRRAELVDFAELLLRSLELLQENQTLRDHYRRQFAHVLIDEFQDTNALQYNWLKMFKSNDNYFIAVGDDDQSIYSWRGACVANLQQFAKDLPDVITIRLEQNYRSTQTILNAANAVINHNTDRLGKQLWSDGDSGEAIDLYPAFNERDEAYFIANTMQQWHTKGRPYQEMAVLYRSNAQSRVLEEQLITQQIPYRIYGGLKFYERAEIKDSIAYLRLMVNPHDDASFERVINTPSRGIGASTLEQIRLHARDDQSSLWHSATHLAAAHLLSPRATQAVLQFIQLIETLKAQQTHLSLDQIIDNTLENSQLRAHYKKDTSEKGLSKVENLEELINAAGQFKPSTMATPIADFLSHIALETGENQSQEYSDCVHLMTLHAAKGLEFPVVFIAGMEEELFPHKMSLDQDHGLAEERRLCYVGITRAMEKLYLSYCESRRMYGMERYCKPSRFIDEIPESLLHSMRTRVKVSRAHRHVLDDVTVDPQQKIKIGQRVRHPSFGIGTIVNYEGRNEQLRLQIRFDEEGTKWLMAQYAHLESI